VGNERGSMAPLVALVVVLAGAACLVLGRLGGVATATARAQTAADAAALAGAADGPDAARALARANGARVARLDVDGDAVEVAVVVGDDIAAVARARSGAVAGGPGGGGSASRVGLDPALVEAVRRAEELLGVPVPITSGWRSRAEQQRLHDDRGSNPYPVARPGMSTHERGRAIDVPRAFAERLAVVAARAGLCRPWPETDPIHFELCRRTP
jgi:hypothetical protein